MNKILKSLTKVAAPVALGLTVNWIASDYKKWKELGKGGVPYNLYGWLQVTYYRLHKRNPFNTEIYEDRIGGKEDSVRLGNLPYRQGPRPRIGEHPVPHRQLDQLANPIVRQQLDKVFDRFVKENNEAVHYTKSFFEKRNEAITLLTADNGVSLANETHGEVAHIHPSDGSMHMVFSPSDAKQVIEKGWGERHSLSGSPTLNIPDTYLLIYTPRNEEELEVINQLLHAAVQHMGKCECGELVHTK